ncbi:transposase [Streptomyces sp. NPDC005799]|uniref:transposase n=1 Tax=Streptomyces sp. NPDC005799 TaxID=3154678 RepID=UPI0033FAC80C
MGASHQYSGALGGVGLCQVAVHLAYASPRGHALIDRELYLPAAWAEDEERRLLRHVPDEVTFATKPQLATAMLHRARQLALPPAGSPATRSTAAWSCAAPPARWASTTPWRSRPTIARALPWAASAPPSWRRRCRPGPGCDDVRATAPRATATTTGP